MLRGQGTATDELRVAAPSLPALDAYAAALAPAWAEGRLSNFGASAQRFEALCADYTGLPHVRAVSSCDVGLTLAVRALGLEPGGRVLVPSFTFASTLHALLWNGLEPCFADVDPDSWCLTAESARAAAGAGDVAAIAGTHAFMATCDVDGLEALALETGAALIFDAAQAFATTVGGTHVGAFGDASVFSFSPTKVATCGEGGLAAFRDPAAAERFALLRGYGSDQDYDSRYVGLNGKLSELHAALGCLTVPRVDREVAHRMALVDRYRERLEPLAGVRLQATDPSVRTTPTQFVIDLGEARDEVASTLGDRGIDTREYFRPLHAMERFRALPAAELPVTERLGSALLALPLHGELDEGDVDRVCSAVEAVLA
jgi:dTDP-4-amino-4,6-dideoxygalactose transaminase